jgi:hypothetical protein
MTKAVKLVEEVNSDGSSYFNSNSDDEHDITYTSNLTKEEQQPSMKIVENED